MHLYHLVIWNLIYVENPHNLIEIDKHHSGGNLSCHYNLKLTYLSRNIIYYVCVAE